MKSLRKYSKATIVFKDREDNSRNGEYWEVNIHTNMVIFFDESGNEHIVPIYYIKEIIEYKEDRRKTEFKNGDKGEIEKKTFGED